MTKPVKRVDLSRLTPEQRAAFIQFYKDAQAVAPQMAEVQQAAVTLFAGLLKTPEWQVVEGQPPADRPPQSVWSIGVPEVNYVDHIERPQP